MTKILWSFEDFMQAIGPHKAHNLTPVPITSVSFDSRTIEPGQVFFAIDWGYANSHTFVPQALEKGAVACVASHIDPAWQGPIIEVKDTVKALENIGHAGRARCPAQIVAVTGSVGKTSTKDMLSLVLSKQGKTHANPRSYNNLWGVPYSLASMPANTQFGIFEIGMNHAGEITPLTQQVQPHVAIITTVCAAHLEFFNSVTDIAIAKSEIFDGLPKNGMAILNRDNPYFMTLCNRARDKRLNIISFGTSERADMRMLSYDFETSRIQAEFLKEIYDYTLSIPGLHQAVNSLSVLAAVHAFGGDVRQASLDLKEYVGTSSRGTREEIHIDNKCIILVDETYNANPGSVQAAISNLANTAHQGRKIILLGEMRELGITGPELHAELAQFITGTDISMVHTCYPLMKHLHEALPISQRGIHAPDSETLLAEILKDIQMGDLIMIKGSLSTNMGLIVKTLRNQKTQKASSLTC